MSWEESTATEDGQRAGGARVGTALFIILTVLVSLCYLAIYVNPHMPLNPFPPVVVTVERSTEAVVAATSTPVLTSTPSPTFPATWTPTATPTWTSTFTPRPTSTPVPPTSTPKPLPAFSLRWDPVQTEQLLYPGATSWWSGLAGEVSDRDGKPVTNIKIKVWDDAGHVWEVTPGDASRYAETYGTSYGGGGTFAWWEQVLQGSCKQSIPVHVQVMRDGRAASSVVTVQTSGDCKKGLVLVHFQKNY